MFKWIKDKLGINSKEEKLEQEKLEQEKLEQEKLEQEKLEQEKLEQEKLEQEKLEQEKLEQEKLEQEKLEQEKLEQEKLEQEKLEQKKLEQEKLEQEKLEQEKLEQEKLEQEKLEQEKLEQEKLDNEKTKKKGFFQNLMDGLTKTRDEMVDKIDDILASYHKIDDDLFMELEEALIMADVGISTTMELIDRLEERVKKERIVEPKDVRNMLKNEIKEIMKEPIESNQLNIDPKPAVILVIGVNGVGKTTTIGKMANSLKEDGNRVLMAAGDTFRAAAIEQLEEWSNRAGVEMIAHKEGADPGAVIYDGIQAAKARKADILICDTAGRLHNKTNLMNELNKIFNIIEKEYGEATKEVLLVLDATTGQNAINQAKTFKEVANITGIALTKLDGTAKGGIAIALQAELGIPIKLVGVGEGLHDLQPFNTDDFVDALF